jgi:hypothetical protein
MNRVEKEVFPISFKTFSKDRRYALGVQYTSHCTPYIVQYETGRNEVLYAQRRDTLCDM